ncbi:P1 family peptidase [Anaerocolumna xylanovorans]|uniref:L-aminopeptidase/D-esterase n=1 Tax=Anaerocolumna xylanovorans DSM 12503 TaxID=1121345 RepID=A0A1M7Y5B0_9FIRM|nr:P1 family peptidase [Anaerocolumna xylanovorans]SHO47666.1 L-aminopeptidase/D-esterase [Anaerocolumna xylanovorans DSM 12503]
METISINDIDGFKIGHAQNTKGATGCTVVISEKGAVCGVDVRGGSPGTRDTDALNPVNNREKVHAVVLAGGSTFGLDSAGGVMRFLEERKIGRDVGMTVVPNVCGAILFDLKCGDYRSRPDAAMGYSACRAAFEGVPWKSGNYGAGTGATIGTTCGIERAMKGGIGSCAFRFGNLMAGAVIAVNCVGDIYDNETDRIIAGMRTVDGKRLYGSEKAILERYQRQEDLFSGNTIIGTIITNAKLNKAQATKLAAVAQNGIVRCVRPAHTIYDGDTIFTLCTGEIDASLDSVGILACKAVEYAILDAVRSADSFDCYTALKDFRPGTVSQEELKQGGNKNEEENRISDGGAVSVYSSHNKSK